MEDLKQIWQQYDEQLQRSQNMNEQLLRKINNRSSASRLTKLRNLEYAGLFVLALLLFLFVGRAGTLQGHTIVQVSYGIVLAQLLLWAAWTLRKISFLSKLKVGELPVAVMLERISRYRRMIMREQLWGGISALLFLFVPLMVVMDFWVNGAVLLLDHPGRYILRTVPALLLGIAAGLWAYNRFYKDPLRDITEDLHELQSLSSVD